MKTGDKIKGFETYWNGVKRNFRWDVMEVLESSVKIKSIVLEESANVAKNQLAAGYSFEQYIPKQRLMNMIKSGEAEIIS